MSFNTDWDVNKYKEEHESEDHWELRKSFMIKWKNDYPEERLICLASVFINMEFMGCRYPTEVMHEVARLSADVAKHYRISRRTKLKRTFVSASSAAEDRAKGIKRQAGIIVAAPTTKSKKINFVPAGQNNNISYEKNDDTNNGRKGVIVDYLVEKMESNKNKTPRSDNTIKTPAIIENSTNVMSDERKSLKPDYLKELSQMECVNVQLFNECMFQTEYGKFILILRPWNDIYNNIYNSCVACKVQIEQRYVDEVYTFIINGRVLATGTGSCKTTAKNEASKVAWNILLRNSITLLMKEQYIPQDKTLISMEDMSSKHDFGQPIEDSVALKMMKHMGWKGGGLGADSQGIAEPIKPNLCMVNRAGLGHGTDKNLQQLRRAGLALLRRRCFTLDADLVFTSEFSPEERAVLHQCANQCGLHSKSYGPKGADRFLVIRNKTQPFAVVRDVVNRGGETPKYRVFIPAALVTNSPR